MRNPPLFVEVGNRIVNLSQITDVEILREGDIWLHFQGNRGIRFGGKEAQRMRGHLERFGVVLEVKAD